MLSTNTDVLHYRMARSLLAVLNASDSEFFRTCHAEVADPTAMSTHPPSF